MESQYNGIVTVKRGITYILSLSYHAKINWLTSVPYRWLARAPGSIQVLSACNYHSPDSPGGLLQLRRCYTVVCYDACVIYLVAVKMG